MDDLVRLLRKLMLFFLRWLPRAKPIPIEDVKRIAIVGYELGLGDLIFFLPVIIGLRRRFPDAAIVYLAQRDDRLHELLETMGLINEFRPIILTFFNALRSLSGSSGFDLLVAEHHFPSALLVPAVQKTPWRAGIVSGGGFRFDYDFLFNIKVESRDQEHVMDRNLRLLDALHIDPPEWPPVEVDAIFNRQPPAPKQAYVVIHPLASAHQLWKCWPLEYYAEACRKLPLPVTVVGTPEENRFLKIALADVATVATESSLLSLTNLIKQARLVIGNDSGIVHLAALLGTPVLALFGPTDEKFYGPRGPRVTILTAQCDSRPCFRHHFIDRLKDCVDRKCMKTISVDSVYEAALSIINAQI